MDVLFTREFFLLWAALLAVALFFPVRHLVWMLYVRGAERQGETDEAERLRLKKRASVTAALICLVFSFLYTDYLFQERP